MSITAYVTVPGRAREQYTIEDGSASVMDLVEEALGAANNCIITRNGINLSHSQARSTIVAHNDEIVITTQKLKSAA